MANTTEGNKPKPPPLGKRRLSKMNRIASQSNESYILNTSSLGLDSSSHLQSSPSTTDSDPLSPQDFYDARTGQESRVKLREHLYGDREDTTPSPVEVVDEDGFDRQPASQPIGGFKHKMARTSTMISKRTSIRLPGLSKAPSRLSMMDNTEDAEAVISEIKAKAVTDSHNALNHGAKGCDDNTARGPIRRRSLFTPGLATRNPENPLRKLSAYMEDSHIQVAVIDSGRDEIYYYNPDLSETSPLGRLAALDLADSRRGSPVLRCATPADRDYGLLGDGLRITNGMASPNPSNRSTIIGSRNTTPIPTHKDSFYTAIGISLHEDDFRAPPDLLAARQHASSPLRVAQSVDSFASVYTVTPPNVSNGQDLGPRKLDTSSVLALEYMSDIPDSPFASTSDLNKPLPFAPTTKANEFEDELFEDRESTPSPVSEKSQSQWRQLLNDDDKIVQDSKMCGTESLPAVPQMVSKVSVTQTESGGHVQIATRTQTSRSAQSAWTTSSSNYGSTTLTVTTTSDPVVSVMRTRPLLSIHQNAQPENRPNISPSDSGYYSSSSSQDAHRQLSYQKLIGASKPNVEPYAVQSDFSTVSYESVPDTSRTGRRPVRETSRFSNLIPRKMTSYKSSTDDVSVKPSVQEPESGTESSKQKKLLRKARPKSMPAPLDRHVITRDREVSGSHIPPVPQAIMERHAERTREFPPLQYTVPHLGHARSSVDVRKIVPVSDPLKFPSPAPPRTERRTSRRLFSGRLNFNSEPLDEDYAGTVLVDSVRPSKSDKRGSRHGVATYGEEIPVVTDFGDVAQYIGGTPYDAASASRRAGYGPKRDTRLQPHHMTNAVPKSKSMVGMNDAQAAEVNRMRAFYRAANMSEQARRELASPELISPRESPPVNVYLPGRLDYYDEQQQRHDTQMGASYHHVVPVVEKVHHYERRVQEQQRYENQYQEPTRTADHSDAAPAFARVRPDWAEHTLAWAQRRQQADGTLQAERPRPTQRMSSPAGGLYQAFSYTASQLDGASHSATALRPSMPTSKAQTQLSLPTTGAPEGIVAQTPGRFEGGFAYGYEPGLGFNGSAGTRGMRSGASRKSVELGQQYGIDLTDVPVFVTPAVST